MVRLTWALGLGFVGLVLLIGTAETGEKKEGKTKGQLPPGWKALKLSSVQLEKIYTIQNDHKVKISDLKKQITELNTKEKGEMYQVLTEAQQAQLKTILTGEAKGKDKDLDKAPTVPEPKKDKAPSEK